MDPARPAYPSSRSPTSWSCRRTRTPIPTDSARPPAGTADLPARREQPTERTGARRGPPPPIASSRLISAGPYGSPARSAPTLVLLSYLDAWRDLAAEEPKWKHLD